MSTLDTSLDMTMGRGARLDDTVDMATTMAILRRQWWVVALVTALFLGLAGVYAVVTPKTWRTSARVMLDPRDKQIVGIDVARPQQSVELGWVETRVELVKSFGVLADVVKKEHLLDDAEIIGTGTIPEVPDEKVSLAVRNLSEMLLVERPKENNLLDVTVTAKSPDKAARLAQAIAESFVARLVQQKVDQVEHAHQLLVKQVDVQRKNMLDAEAKVEEYKRANGIAVTRGNLVDEETLRQSNENLVAARVKAQEAKERWEKLKAVLKSGDPAFHSQIDAVGSAVIGRLKIDAAQAARKKIEIEQEFGPLHPKSRIASAEAERGRDLLLAEVRSLASTAEMDWQLARAAEDNIRKNVERAQSRLADTTQATVALQELENEANARRELYKSFVARLQETTLQKSTQVSDATVVSPAQVPLRPWSPRLGLALPLALVAGLGVGISVALWRGRAAMLAAANAPLAPPPAPATRYVAGHGFVPVAPAAPAPARAAAAPPRARDAGRDRPRGAAPEEPAERAARRGRRGWGGSPDDARTDTRADAPRRLAGAETWAATGTGRPGPAPRVPVRVDLTLMPERIARLGAAPGPGTGAASALVEIADGRPDFAGLAMLRRLGDELGHGEGPEIRAVFSNEVPTSITAALAHGLARAACEADSRVLLIDLAAEAEVLAPAFDEAGPMPHPDRRRTADAWETLLDDHGLALARPRHEAMSRDPARRGDRLREFLETARRDADAVIVHLGRAPAAALLCEVGEIADHLALVVDEKDVGTRRLQGEIDVVTDMVESFDGLVVLRVAADDPGFDPREERRRRAR